jgi:glycolate oxidase
VTRGRDRALRAALAVGRAIGESRVITDEELLERFAGDESDQEPVQPHAAVIPASAEQAAAVMRIASEHSVPVTPRAGGTGKSGGAVPVQGGIVLSCEKLTTIKEIHEEDLVAVVEPGVVLGRLHEAVEERGLFYPPDPASLESCCLGGNVAENAGGPRAFKYGVTSHYVLRLEVVTAAGDMIRVGHRPVKGVAGYDLPALFVGSEGTLGLFTEITLRLLPGPPHVSTLLAPFPDLPAAGRGVGAILAAGLIPRVLEIMDARCVDTVRSEGAALPPGAAALILAELDGSEAGVEADLQVAGTALDGAGASEILVASGPVERERLWKARRDLSEALGRSHSHKISDDIAVPRSRLVETLERLESIAADHHLTGATFGHAGDGNLHVNFMWDDPGLDGEADAARAATMRLALEMDGTVSGEHGIGSVKRQFLADELGPGVLDLGRSFKRLLDPRGILNPGKLY